MNTATKSILLLLASSSLAIPAAEQGEEIIQVKKSTFVNLVDLLVKRGVINQQEGSGLVSAAEQEAADMATDRNAQSGPANAQQGQAADREQQAAGGAGMPKAAGKASKHVSYVPEFVKKEMRDDIRAELKSEVVKEVKQDAKTEGWGVPAAMPEWVSALHPTFDMRVRFQDNFFGSGNQSGLGIGPYNFLNINSLYTAGITTGLSGAEAQSPTSTKYAYINNTKDQLKLSERLRLGFEADIADGVKAGVRFATSNIYNPVSNNQTLGNTGQSYEFAIDRSYLQYDYLDSDKTSWFSAYGGRIINPFMSTDIVFDPDLSFEGLAGSFRYHMNRNDPAVRGYKADNPTGRVGVNQGQQSPDSVFMTLGVFPIQNVNFSSNSKWLYAGQLGADWLVFKDSRLNFGLAYYEYQNISARYNSASDTNGHEYDWTAPQFLQQGNSIVAITDSNTAGGTVCSDPTGCLFGLASQFRIINATAIYDYLYAGQTHVLFTADVAKNLGYNQQQILSQFSNGLVNYSNSAPRTLAYQARIDIGHPRIARSGDWNFSFAYRYVQRDAVLDAFTDSIFHNGGTNAKGWVMAAQYGLAKNTWMNMHWYSTNAIDGPTYNVDTVNFDLNTRF
ncbi:MAG: putative porin [Methylococcales bacterium]|nr:putative porin [Methylococcales bacterium]